MLQDYRIILVSNSPRRRELLGMMDIDYTTGRAECEETVPEGMAADEQPVYLSRLKADNYCGTLDDSTIVIGADTMVIVGGKPIGKPANEAEARDMLRRLSGRSHKVVTGVTLRTLQHTISFSETTEVDFKPLCDDEIDHYINRYRPLDKAGAYGIQEWIGLIGISAIRGCYYNVMGLPTQRLYLELQKLTTKQ